MFLVLGITGKVGGAAVRRLLADGKAVRGLVRDPDRATEWSRAGVDVRKGGFNDADAITDALSGVEAAFFMLPPFFTPAPGFPEAQAMIQSFRTALRNAPPPRVVALSAVGSQQPVGLGMITATHLLEEGLDDAPFPTAFVRAGSFLENYIQNLKPAAETGRFDSFLQPTTRTFPMIASEDIGAEVARLLTSSWTGKKIVELGSPISPDDLALAMGKVLGRKVDAHSIPRGEWEAALQKRGMPPGFIGPYLEMEDGFNSGWIDFGAPGAERVGGMVTAAKVFAQAKVC